MEGSSTPSSHSMLDLSQQSFGIYSSSDTTSPVIRRELPLNKSSVTNLKVVSILGKGSQAQVALCITSNHTQSKKESLCAVKIFNNQMHLSNPILHEEHMRNIEREISVLVSTFIFIYMASNS